MTSSGPYLERLPSFDQVYGYQYNRIVDALTNNRPQGTVNMAQCYDVCFGYQPVDSVFRARFRFRVHATIDTIISVGLNFSLQPFHVGNQTTAQTTVTTSSSNTSGGTSHSHALASASGTISQTAGFDGSGNLVNTGVAPNLVSVGIEYLDGSQTSGQPPGPHHLGTHTHTIPALNVNIPSLNLNPPTAIYEAGMAQGVHVFIDGIDQTTPLGGPWGSGSAIDITDIAIGPYVNTTGWHEVQLSSTSIGGITCQIRMSTLLNGSL